VEANLQLVHFPKALGKYVPTSSLLLGINGVFKAFAICLSDINHLHFLTVRQACANSILVCLGSSRSAVHKNFEPLSLWDVLECYACSLLYVSTRYVFGMRSWYQSLSSYMTIVMWLTCSILPLHCLKQSSVMSNGLFPTLIAVNFMLNSLHFCTTIVPRSGALVVWCLHSAKYTSNANSPFGPPVVVHACANPKGCKELL